MPTLRPILIAGPGRPSVQPLARTLAESAYIVRTATSAARLLKVLRDDAPDLVVLHDGGVGGLSAGEICEANARELRSAPILLVSSVGRGGRACLEWPGVEDLVQAPVDPLELRLRINLLLRLKHYAEDRRSAEDVVRGLAMTIEGRDSHTHGHCQRVAAYAEALGTELGLAVEDLDDLRRGAFLHDIGKVGMPDAVLLKPAPLDALERAIVRRHPVIGDSICGRMKALERIRPIVRHHHERLDGSGYPDALRADAIPLLAQIVGLVDSYDALTSTRPYRSLWTPARALEELHREAERGWRQTDLVAALARLIEVGQLASPAGEL